MMISAKCRLLYLHQNKFSGLLIVNLYTEDAVQSFPKLFSFQLFTQRGNPQWLTPNTHRRSKKKQQRSARPYYGVFKWSDTECRIKNLNINGVKLTNENIKNSIISWYSLRCAAPQCVYIVNMLSMYHLVWNPMLYATGTDRDMIQWFTHCSGGTHNDKKKTRVEK